MAITTADLLAVLYRAVRPWRLAVRRPIKPPRWPGLSAPPGQAWPSLLADWMARLERLWPHSTGPAVRARTSPPRWRTCFGATRAMPRLPA